jgi:hypothetical protein
MVSQNWNEKKCIFSILKYIYKYLYDRIIWRNFTTKLHIISVFHSCVVLNWFCIPFVLTSSVSVVHSFFNAYCFIRVVLSKESLRGFMYICVLVVSICSYDLSIGLWYCSDSMVSFVYHLTPIGYSRWIPKTRDQTISII